LGIYWLAPLAEVATAQGRMTAVEVVPSDALSAWQERYGELARTSRRVAPFIAAAE